MSKLASVSASITLKEPNNYSCTSKQEQMLDLQTEFSSPTPNLALSFLSPQLPAYIIS
jgi:hypothetical protein